MPVSNGKLMIMENNVSLDLMEFVEQQILPRYNAFGHSHGLRHVLRVIKNSLLLAKITGADMDMVYVVAAYHDLGMSGPRAIHHLTGGRFSWRMHGSSDGSVLSR